MPERKREAQTYIIRYYCDAEGCEGEMLPTGRCLTSSPPQYPHVCNECGAKKTFRNKIYPVASYEEPLQAQD